MPFGLLARRYPNLKNLPNYFWSELQWAIKWGVRLYVGALLLAMMLCQLAEDSDKLAPFVALQFVTMPPSLLVGMPLFYAALLTRIGDIRYVHHVKSLVERRNWHELGFRDDPVAKDLFEAMPFSYYGVPPAWISYLYGMSVWPGVYSGYWWCPPPSKAMPSSMSPAEVSGARTLYIDQALAQSIASDYVDQIVIFWGGFDTRPYGAL